MPVPAFTGLGPEPNFQDVVNKVNTIVGELQQLLLTLDTLNIKKLNAQVIEAGTITGDKIAANAITADKIAANAVTADKIDVNELSAITANLGHITAGLIEAVQIFGSYIATSQNYPKVEFASTENFIKASQDPNRFLQVSPFSGNAPAIQFFDGVNGKSLLMYVFSSGSVISAVGDLILGGNNVVINGVNFNSKADKSNVTKTVYVSSVPGDPADTPLRITNGVVTS